MADNRSYSEMAKDLADELAAESDITEPGPDAYYYGDEVYYGTDPYASGGEYYEDEYYGGGYSADPYTDPYADDEDDENMDELSAEDDGFDGENVVLCVSNGYTKQYYFNRMFGNIPKSVQDELKIMCVWFTEECGGILTLEFDDDGNLLIKQTTSEYDGYYDQVGSELKINQMRRERKEFLMALELYYKVVAMGMSAGEIEASGKYED